MQIIAVMKTHVFGLWTENLQTTELIAIKLYRWELI